MAGFSRITVFKHFQKLVAERQVLNSFNSFSYLARQTDKNRPFVSKQKPSVLTNLQSGSFSEPEEVKQPIGTFFPTTLSLV